MKKRILLAEDNIDLRFALHKALTDNNFDVTEAADGAEALKMVEKEHPDLVLLDFGLPIVPGETVCIKIKEEHPEIVVIAVTQKALSSDVIHGLQIGADDYISKPFSMEELLARIHTRLKRNAPKEGEKLTKEKNKPSHVIFKESFTLVAFRLITLELITGVILIIISMLSSFLAVYYQVASIVTVSFFINLILLTCNLITVLFVVLRWHSEYFELVQENLIKHTGILSKQEQNFACHFVETVTLEQSIVGRIFNYGTITLYDPSLKETISLYNIANPQKNKTIIDSIISAKRNSSARSGSMFIV